MSEGEVELSFQLHPKAPEITETTLDDLLAMIRGKRGCFQICLGVFGLCVIVPTCMCATLPLFILTIPDHRCALDGWDNDTYNVQNSQHRQLINASIPVDENGKMSSCTIFRYDDVIGSSDGNRSEVSCQRWVYDKTLFHLSLIEELDLVCDRKHTRTVANMLLLLGKVMSMPVHGVIGDHFGRKVTITICAVSLIFGAWSTLLIYDILSLYIIRFLTGVGTAYMYLASFVLIIEFQVSEYRRKYNCLLYMVWCVGIFMMIPLAYFVSNYWKLSIAIGCITTLLSFGAWFVPESPRWLLSKGRISEARTILQCMARVNSVTFPDDVYDQVASSFKGLDQRDKRKMKRMAKEDITKYQDNLIDVVSNSSEPSGTRKLKPEAENFVQFLKHKSLCLRFFILILNWCTFELVYVALMFNLSNVGGSLYLNFGLFNLVEIIGIAVAYLTMERIGRTLSYRILLMLSTTACLASIFPVFLASDGISMNIMNVLSLIGRLGNAGALMVFFLHSSELVPTAIRNTALSTLGTSGRISGIFGPFVADLGLLLGGQFQAALPLLVCGAMGVLAFVSALALPETKGTPLPNTIEEARRQKEKTRHGCCASRWIPHQRSGV